MASRNAPGPIDVDLFDEPPKRPVRRPVRRSSPTPIVISDDESEVVEVATKLEARTRSISADSEVEIVKKEPEEREPDVIDLVSDDEEVEVSNSSKGKSVQRRESTADIKHPIQGSRRESASADIKPVVNASGSVYQPIHGRSR